MQDKFLKFKQIFFIFIIIAVFLCGVTTYNKNVFASGMYNIIYHPNYEGVGEYDVISQSDVNGQTFGYNDELTLVTINTLDQLAYEFSGGNMSFKSEGQSFLGWALTQNGNVVYSDGQSINFPSNSNLDLYAKWGDAPTVSFSGSGNI